MRRPRGADCSNTPLRSEVLRGILEVSHSQLYGFGGKYNLPPDPSPRPLPPCLATSVATPVAPHSHPSPSREREGMLAEESIFAQGLGLLGGCIQTPIYPFPPSRNTAGFTSLDIGWGWALLALRYTYSKARQSTKAALTRDLLPAQQCSQFAGAGCLGRETGQAA